MRGFLVRSQNLLFEKRNVNASAQVAHVFLHSFCKRFKATWEANLDNIVAVQAKNLATLDVGVM